MTRGKTKAKPKIPHQWEHYCTEKKLIVTISHAIHFCPFCKKRKP